MSTSEKQTSLESTYCIKCGAKGEKMIGKTILDFTMLRWDGIDKQVRSLIKINGGMVTLAFSGLGVEVVVSSQKKESNV